MPASSPSCLLCTRSASSIAVVNCFHCVCTVCAAPLLTEKGDRSGLQLTCQECHSQTHLGCARNPLDGAFVQRSESNAPYHCSVDCLLRVRLHANPNYHRGLSDEVEATTRQRFKAICDIARSQSAQSSESTTQPPVEEVTASVPTSESLPLDGAFPPPLENGLLGAFAQLRFEAWRVYFIAERHGFAHAVWFPPTGLDAGDLLLGHAAELMSATGQAERCYLLDALQHPVGSVIALPSDSVWKNFKRLKVGDSNSFVAESMDTLLTTSVMPVLVSEVTLK